MAVCWRRTFSRYLLRLVQNRFPPQSTQTYFSSMSVGIGWGYIHSFCRLAGLLVASCQALLFKHWAGGGIFGYLSKLTS